VAISPHEASINAQDGLVIFFFFLLLFFMEKKVTKKATGKQYTACFPEPP
jgi:hypothetical protein